MNEQLAQGLLQAVRAQDFGHTADSLRGGKPLLAFPSIDLAVVSFAPGRAALWANVLFSREHPQGHVASIAHAAGPVQGLRFDADQQDGQGQSALWLPGADWSRTLFVPLQGTGPLRFVAPYPASLLKLMVAVGVALAVDEGRCAWPEALEPMIVVSSNEATDECVALLHRVGWLAPASDNRLNRFFLSLGLRTLQLNHTSARGGWRNADGAGVGHIHMTAWDTVRLLWWLDPEAPPPPWLAVTAAGLTLALQPATRLRLMDVLARQQLNEILSSGSLRGQPGWVPGLPDAPTFAHKTGTTDNYAADAGRVWLPAPSKPGGRPVHYLVAVLTNLGRRYAAAPTCATTWRLPELGAAVHHWMETWA